MLHVSPTVANMRYLIKGQLGVGSDIELVSAVTLHVGDYMRAIFLR
jgi:hypothetical protein